MSNVQEHLINRIKFLEALKSPEYKDKQIVGNVRSFEMGADGRPNYSYCAIGLANHLLGRRAAHWSHGNFGNIQKQVSKKYNMTCEQIEAIIKWNDSGCSFEMIARELENLFKAS